ncbi:transcriptional regulator [Sphingomonas paeninsulae]|jgi:hypothetical protein|uniref:Transcriptional regulator n=1 Tax=Sphingomonas paeninsulae TaxID=2319844 RepID=A0A494T8B3_SPHPE|nr:cupin-like domain-containing protein [Sphingomonas paeninsulae]AYJ85569.1 transcriptional regulator [Sphingomonas paeninsulae]
MRNKAFPTASIEDFKQCYPDSILKLKHDFLDHPLMEIPELLALSERLPASVIEHNIGALPIGIGQHEVPKHSLSVLETIASIEESASWAVLKNIELDPTYRALLHDVLSEIRPAVEAITGPMLNLVGFIFISSPNSVTPFHSDPEYNILLQTRGEKTMTLFSGTDESIIPAQFHEIYHTGGPRTVLWKDEFEAKGKSVTLRAGDAIYVPLKWPHYVKNGSEVSISLSVTWRSRWSYAEADTRAFNKILRNFGLNPAPPRPLPHRNVAKSTAWRALRKVGVRL